MSNARNLADLLDSNGDVKATALDNDPTTLTDLGVTATSAELNYIDGVTSNVQTQLDGKQSTLVAGTDYLTPTGDGSSLTGINTDLVSDTTPQLGGDLDTNGNAITGSTVAINGSSGEFMISATENGPVALRYDNNLKLTTKSDGVDITGELQADSLDIDGDGDITGNLTLGGNLNLGDNDKAQFGASNDLQIYHDTFNSYIKDSGTGDLRIWSDNPNIATAAGNKIFFGNNGVAELYYTGGVKKLATTSSGIDVTGTVTSDGFTSNGNGTITGDLLIQEGSGFPRITLKDSDGTNTQSFINHSGSDLTFTAQNNTSNGRILFSRFDGTTTTTSGYFDANGKFFATASVDVTGDIDLVDNGKLKLGNSDDLQIYHDGSNSYIKENGTGNLYIQATSLQLENADGTNFVNCVSEGTVALYYNNSKKFETTSTGVKVTGGTSDSLLIESVDGGTADAPDLVLYRNSASPADNDKLGVIQFRGKHSGGTTHNYVQIQATATDITDATEDAHLSFYIANAGSNGEEFRMKGNGDFHADGDVIAYSTTISDERLKENIQPIDDALAKVKQLKGCTFTYTADGKESAGLIAQDVEKVLPSAVSEKELPLKQDDGKEYKVLQYDQTIGLLVEAIKELSAKVEELENK